MPFGRTGDLIPIFLGDFSGDPRTGEDAIVLVEGEVAAPLAGELVVGESNFSSSESEKSSSLTWLVPIMA